MMIPLGPFRLNTQALAARIVYRWQSKIVVGLTLTLLISSIGTGVMPPFWRDYLSLTILAAPNAAVSVNGQPWPRHLRTGTHVIETKLADGRVSRVDLSLHTTTPITLTVPAGLFPPRIHRVPPAAPGTFIHAAWWADGGWRLTSKPAHEPETEGRQPTSAPSSGLAITTSTVALRANQLEALPTLDAYNGKADVLQHNQRQYQAVYQPPATSYGGQATGTIEIHGWSIAAQTVAVSATVTLVRWSPTADAVVISEQIGQHAEQLRLLRRDGNNEALVAIPGVVRHVVWSPRGNGLVVVSEHEQRLLLTLVRVTPQVASRVIADLPSWTAAPELRERMPLVPVHWHENTVEWLAPDDHGQASLWQASLSALLPQRVQPLAALAVARLPSGSLRIAQLRGDRVLIGQQHNDVFVAQAELSDIRVTGRATGIWAPQGDQLLLQADHQLWLVELDARDTQPASQ